MKKFIITATAIAFIGIGGSPAFAQTPAPNPPVLPGVTLPLPIECSERTGGSPVDGQGGPISPNCVDFYIEVAALPPVVASPAAVVPAVVPPVLIPSIVTLPSTGSGVSPLLGMGAALLVGGGIVVVATRRRSTATAN